MGTFGVGWLATRGSRVVLLLTMTLASLFVVPSVGATTAIVSTCADSGAGSLRDAIENTTADTITFNLNCNTSSPITFMAGSTILTISRDLAIDATGHTIVIDGGDLLGVFNISGNFTVQMTALTIQNGNDSGTYAGGINNNGTLTLTNCTLTNNTSAGGGGGIYDAGTLTVTNSVFSGNKAIGGSGGGAIEQVGPQLKVTNSTFNGNMADASGGGIDNSQGTTLIVGSTFDANSSGTSGGGISNNGGSATLTVVNSTFSSNTATGNGGGLNNSGDVSTLTVVNSTLSGNTAATGGGIQNDPSNPAAGHTPTLSLTDALVAGNTATTGPDVAGNVATDGGHNLIGNGTGLTGLTNGTNNNQVGTAGSPINAQLGPLNNNGGPTRTRALLTGSPAIDTGGATCPSYTDPITMTSVAITTDQRGLGRPFGAGCDIGAFESQVAAAVTLTSLSQSGGTTAGGDTIVVTGTGFGTNAANISVRFGTASGDPLGVVSNVSNTRFTVTTPPHSAGTVQVQVTVNGMVIANTLPFTFGVPSAQPAQTKPATPMLGVTPVVNPMTRPTASPPPAGATVNPLPPRR